MVSAENWRIRIDRARFLTRRFPESAHLLEFYIRVAELQQEIYNNTPSDVSKLAAYLPKLRALPGPEPLMQFALTDDLLASEPSSEQAQFFWRVLMQPYVESRVLTAPAGRGSVSRAFESPRLLEPRPTGALCPSCGSKPVAGVMRGEGDGAKRALICSLCATEWPYRRLICANCGEEQGKIARLQGRADRARPRRGLRHLPHLFEIGRPHQRRFRRAAGRRNRHRRVEPLGRPA